MKLILSLIFILVVSSHSKAQLPAEIQVDFLSKGTQKLIAFADRRKTASIKYLSRFNKNEAKFLHRLCKKNPQKADALFRSWSQSQQRLNLKLTGQYKNPFDKPTTVYNSYNDTLLNSLECAGDETTLNAVSDYKKQLNEENYIRDYMRQQKLTMKKVSLDVPGMKGAFKGIDKSSYYYVQQLNDYDQWFSKSDKWEEMATGLLKQNTDFTKFMSENSQLASFPKIPSGSIPSIDGLQTNSMVRSIQQRDLSSLTDEGKDLVKEKITAGAMKIANMKTNLPFLSNAADVPEFKPNPLKTKRIIDRLHYGFDFQFDNRTSFVPKGITSAINGEYDLLPKATIGLGIAYHTPFKKIGSEHKSTSLPPAWSARSYVDYKIKSVLFFTVNYERTYPSSLDKWTQSAMAGLKLKYSIKGKLAPSVSLMYDFLFDQHSPNTQMIVYRLGWKI